MTRFVCAGMCAVVCAALATALAAQEPPTAREVKACTVQASGTYGFQCHGSAFNGSFFEPVTFIGTVEGKDNVYEGFGVFNSSNGSADTHVKGTATFRKNCFGRVEYTTNEILLPGGGTVPLPPVIFDFTVVAGGREIQGTGAAPAGVTGEFVPRLTCRLVKMSPDPDTKGRGSDEDKQ